MKIGIIGRTNVGKSTMYKALTLEEVAVEDRPFTTIDPNRGIGYVNVDCPEKEFHTKCNPHNAPCIDGTRYVPVEIIDVAGLIEGASSGKGLGTKFLSEAMEADALIEVIDISGKTDGSGMKTEGYDPGRDIEMVRTELISWMGSIILRYKPKSGEDKVNNIYRGLSGLRINQETIKNGIKDLGIKEVDETAAGKLAEYILSRDKPIVIACNKMDATPELDKKISDLKNRFGYEFVPCSAAAELTLKEAEKHGYVSYNGKTDFAVIKTDNSEQEKALTTIKNILKKYNGTGVRQLLEKVIFTVKSYKVVFPVVDEKRLTDGNGRILPDAYLVRNGATPREVAGMIHSDFAEKYKGAIDCRTGLKIKNDEPVKNGQIIKIIV